MSDKNEIKRLVAYARKKGLKVSFVGQMTLHDYAAMNPVEGKVMGWDIGKNEIEVDKHRPLNKQVRDLRHEFVEMGLMKAGQPYAEAHLTALKLEGVKLTPPELDALAKIGSYSVEHIHDDGDLTIKTKDGDYVVTTEGQTFKGTKNQEMKMVKRNESKFREDLPSAMDILQKAPGYDNKYRDEVASWRRQELHNSGLREEIESGKFHIDPQLRKEYDEGKLDPKSPPVFKGENKEATMPAKSEKQRRFAGAELSRLRAGKPTQSGMTEKQLEELASKENHEMPHKRDDRETNTRRHRISERPVRITERPAIRSRKPVTIGQHRPRIY